MDAPFHFLPDGKTIEKIGLITEGIATCAITWGAGLCISLLQCMSLIVVSSVLILIR